MKDLDFVQGNWDISQYQNDIVFNTGGAEVSQNSRIRLLFLLGEQFDDTRVGVPWLSDMVSTLVSIDAKREIIRSIIIKTFGVKSLDELRVSATDDGAGIGFISFSGTTQNGEFFNAELNR